jgi:hypothetical protein
VVGTKEEFSFALKSKKKVIDAVIVLEILLASSEDPRDGRGRGRSVWRCGTRDCLKEG